LRKDQGVVLLFVMGVVAVLAALAVELAARASVEVLLASRASREAAFRRLVDSGIELGKGLLKESEAQLFDFWGERWNQEIRFTLSPTESVTVQVSDESGKINIVQKPTEQGDGTRLARQLARLFDYLRRFEPGRTEELRGMEARLVLRLGLLPAEKGEVPMKPDPLFTLDGLREAGLSVRQVFGKGGLARYLTCFGDGKINLNTAPRAVLYALDEDLDVEMADRISAWRGDPDGKAGIYKPFEDPKDLELVQGVVERSTFAGQAREIRNLYSKIQSQVTAKSTAFAVHIQCDAWDRMRDAWAFFEPGREERAGEKPHRTLRRVAYEEILP
jgi:general secretion pathway protein K